MAAKASVTETPAVAPSIPLSASGISSANTIQIIAPAASPKPKGSRGAKNRTKRYAGMAISGCGKLVKILQPAALRTEIPLGIRTKLIARPSGIL